MQVFVNINVQQQIIHEPKRGGGLLKLLIDLMTKILVRG